MTKIRVLHAVEALKVGGLEAVLADIVLNLNKELFDVEVITLAGKGQIAEELINQGISLRMLDITNYHRPSALLKIIRTLRKGKYDILHTHGYFASTSMRAAAILARIPVVLSHVQNTHWHYAPCHLRTERFLSYFTDLIYCCSMAVRDFVVKSEKISEKKVKVLYNAARIMDESPQEPPDLPIAIGVENKIIITVSRLVEQKGHRFLIDAVPKVIEKFPNAIFLLVGDGILKSTLRAQIERLRLTDCVIFLGERRDVFSLLKIADIFVLPSSGWEGLGIALVEAMAMGLPLVGTSLGGIPEVIGDGINGFLVSPKNSDQLADAVIRLLKNERLAHKMGKNGQKIYHEKFTVKRMIQAIEKDYLTLLSIKDER